MNPTGTTGNFWSKLEDGISGAANSILAKVDLSKVKTPGVKVGLDGTTIAVVFVILLVILKLKK